MTRRTWFWTAVFGQIMVLAGIILLHSYTLVLGTPMLLQPVPRDPWDPIRGEYVALRYSISSFKQDEIPMTGFPYTTNQRIWITMRQAEDSSLVWTPVAISDERPSLGTGELALRGTVNFVLRGFSPNAPPPPSTVHVSYGIEEFFVPEGRARMLEERLDDLQVQVFVDPRGRAAIGEVLLGGEPIKWR